MSLSAPENIDEEIQALAGALVGLGASGEANTAKAVRIFNWVRNNIEYEHYSGLRKGAALTLLEGSGNDFDQAALLRELLVAAGYSSDDVKLRLRGHFVDYADFVPWIGMAPEPFPGQTYAQAYGRTIAEDFPGVSGLGNLVAKQLNYGKNFLKLRGSSHAGGDPQYWPTPLPGKASFLFDRMWVELTIGGTTYDLDPSYKTCEKITASQNVPAAMGYSRSALLSAAGGTSSAGYSISSLDKEEIAEYLDARTTALLAKFRDGGENGWLDASLEELIGGRRIIRHDIESLSEGFPLAKNFFNNTNVLFDSVEDPNLTPYKTIIRFQGAGMDYAISTAELKGRKISLTFSGTQAALRLDDGEPVATAAVSTGTFALKATVDHFRHPPYPEDPPNGPPVPTYYRQNAFAYVFPYACSSSARLLQKRHKQLRAYLAEGKSDSSREVRTELLNIIGLTWMYQTHLSSRLLADETNVLHLFTHRFGRIAQEQGFYVDVLAKSADMPDDRNINSGSRYDAVFHFGSVMASGMEHGVIEQLQPGVTAVSTVNILRKAGATSGNALFLTGSSNWSTVKNQLVNYSNSYKDNLTNAVNAGAVLFLPKNAAVHEGSWTGTGLILRFPDEAGMNIAGGYSGGFATQEVDVASQPIRAAAVHNPAAAYSSDASPTYDNTAPSPYTPRYYTWDPVDMATGDFVYKAEDMTTGIEGAPRGLNFCRYYSSAAIRENDQKLGFGWSHNYHMRALDRAALEEALGEGSPKFAASFLVASLIGPDLYRLDATAKEWGVAAFVVGWCLDRMKDSAVSVRLGKDVYQFLKNPDGTYEPPPGSTSSLAKIANKYEITERHGNTIKFDAEGKATKIVDPDGRQMSIGYIAHTGDDVVSYVEDSNNRRFNFTYQSGRLTKITDSIETARFIQFGYDGENNLTSFTDPEGKKSYYDYEISGSGSTAPDHRILRLRNDDGQPITRNFYDALGRIEKQYLHGDENKAFHLYYTGRNNYEVDPEGGITHFYYDDRGRPVGKRDQSGHLTGMTYDTNEHVATETTPEGEVTTYHYDDFNNLTQVDHPRGGGSTIMQYDSLHRLDLVTDPNNFQTKYNYYTTGSSVGKNRPKEVISAYGTTVSSTTTYQYMDSGPAMGRVWKVTDGDGLMTEHAYDSLGHPDWTKAPGAFTTNFTYSGRGDMLNKIYPNFTQVNYTYNKRRQLVEKRYNDLGGHETLTYDNQRRLQSAFQPVQNESVRIETSFTYSPTDKVLLEKVSGTTVADHRYDSRDWESKVYDAAGRETQFPRNANGALHQTVRPGSRVSTHGYDDDGRLVSQTDPGANTGNRSIGFSYDTEGGYPRTTFTDSDHRSAKSISDRLGNLRFYTNKKGNTFEFRYDALGRRTHVITPLDASLGRSTQTSYTRNGRISTLTEPSGDTVAHAYDSATGRLSSVTYQKAGGGSTLAEYTSYDANGQVLAMNEGASTASYSYTYSNDLVWVRSATINGQTFGYRYYQNGRLYKLIYPGGSESGPGHVIYGYWPNGRLKGVNDRLDSVSSPRLTTYYWHPDGRLDKIVKPNGSIREIGYDSVTGRAASIVEKTSGGTVIAQYAASYYPSDELKTLTATPQIPPVQLAPEPNAAMTFNAGEQIATFNGQTVTHDPDGNMTNGPLPSGIFDTYVYDSRNRLQSAGGLTYSYDTEGNRVGIGGSETQSFTVDSHSGPLSRVLTRTKNGQTTRYVYGVGLLYEVNSSGDVTYYHYDQIGNTVALTNQSGSVVERVAYAPYGSIRYRQSNFDTPFLYGGNFGVMTDSNGLLCMRARYYNPLTRRFINSDPARDGWNWYVYAEGNPVMFVDPTGLYITYRQGGDERYWDNYKSSYADMLKSTKGRELLSFLENTKQHISVGGTILAPDGTSLTSAAQPGLTTTAGNSIVVVLDNRNGLGNRLLIPHEFYHAAERVAGREQGAIFMADPFNWGTASTIYPSWDRLGIETRTVRGANMMAMEFGAQTTNLYGKYVVPYATGVPADQRVAPYLFGGSHSEPSRYTTPSYPQK